MEASDKWYTRRKHKTKTKK